MFWNQSYNEREDHSHRGSNRRPTIGTKKQNQNERKLRINPRRLLREVGVVFGVHHTTVWYFLRDELKLFPYCLQNERQLSKIDKENCVAFA